MDTDKADETNDCVGMTGIRNLPYRLIYKIILLNNLDDHVDKESIIRTKGSCSKISITTFFKRFTLWKHTLKVVEINFGTNVMLYFMFIKFLLSLNVFISILAIGFIVVPNILHNSALVSNALPPSLDYSIILDIFQGTGILENSFIFYSFYSNSTIEYVNIQYTLPFAYIVVQLLCLLTSATLIIRISVKQFEQRVISNNSTYGSMVYANWIFSIYTREVALKRHADIAREMISTFKLDTVEENRKSIYRERQNKIMAARVAVNLFFIVIIASSAFCIYYVFFISSEYLLVYENNLILTLCFQFLPSVTIILVSKIIPLMFSFLIKFELYSAIFKLRIILFRMVFVRMFSLCVVYVTLYNQIEGRGSVCWENKVGQHMYKMLLTEFFVHLLSVFIINLVVEKLIKIVKKTYAPSFDLPKNVLDMVFMQTIAWFGMFYSPLLPTYLIIMYLILFYTKRFEVMRTMANDDAFSHRHHSNSSFMSVLLTSFLFAFIPQIFCIGTLSSSSCGPFSGTAIPWDVVVRNVSTWNCTVQNILNSLQSMSVVSAIFLILSLGLYFYIARVSTNTLLIKEIRKHLSNLGMTKQHLRNIYHKYNIVHE